MSTIVIPYISDINFFIPDVVASLQQMEYTAPYDGEIVAFTGSIAVLGTGAGRVINVFAFNETRNYQYFENNPQFQVDSGEVVTQGGRLKANAMFSEGDILRVYITSASLPTGASDIVFRLTCKFFKRVAV